MDGSAGNSLTGHVRPSPPSAFPQEGTHVDALDLVDVVARLELAREEDLALVVLVKGGDGSLVIKSVISWAPHDAQT